VRVRPACPQRARRGRRPRPNSSYWPRQCLIPSGTSAPMFSRNLSRDSRAVVRVARLACDVIVDRSWRAFRRQRGRAVSGRLRIADPVSLPPDRCESTLRVTAAAGSPPCARHKGYRDRRLFICPHRRLCQPLRTPLRGRQRPIWRSLTFGRAWSGLCSGTAHQVAVPVLDRSVEIP
jgi:hypothetical protein